MMKVVTLLVLWLAVFYPIYPELMRDWFGNSDNSHAFLVPFISLYLVWQRKGDLQSTPVDSSVCGAIILAASLLAYIASYAGGVAFPGRIAMVSSLFGLIWFCLGSGFIRVLAFPIAFLAFMVPVPYSLMSLVSAPLQIMATRVSADLIAKCSIPVYREGNMLYFVKTQLEVAEACSGIRSITSLTMVGFLFCYLSKDRWRSKALLIAAILPIAIFANVVRVTGTGILAHFYGDMVAKGFVHQFSGAVIFILGFVLLFMVFAITNRKKIDDIE